MMEVIQKIIYFIIIFPKMFLQQLWERVKGRDDFASWIDRAPYIVILICLALIIILWLGGYRL